MKANLLHALRYLGRQILRDIVAGLAALAFGALIYWLLIGLYAPNPPMNTVHTGTVNAGLLVYFIVTLLIPVRKP